MRFALDQHLYAPHGQNKLKTETVSEPEARLDIYSKSKKQNAKQKQIHVAASNAAYNALWALPRVLLSLSFGVDDDGGDTAAAAVGSAARIVPTANAK